MTVPPSLEGYSGPLGRPSAAKVNAASRGSTPDSAVAGSMAAGSIAAGSTGTRPAASGSIGGEFAAVDELRTDRRTGLESGLGRDASQASARAGHGRGAPDGESLQGELSSGDSGARSRGGSDADALAEVAPEYELRPAGRPAGRTLGSANAASTKRIYLVGAHSTGKTTLARWVRDRFGLPMISEVARGVLAEMEAQLDALRSDVELVNRYQRQVFERQLEAERQQRGGFVSDRAFCNLAYAAHHSTVLSGIATDPRLRDYMDSVRGGIVLYLRPHRELVRADGVRAGLEWEEVVRIDGMVKLLLEMFAVPYVAVESLSMQERVRTVETILGLAGVRPITESRVERSLPSSS
jgi:nicotinamide riboside kinase